MTTNSMRTGRTFLVFCNRNRNSHSKADAERIEKDRQLHFELCRRVEMRNFLPRRVTNVEMYPFTHKASD
jgi:hypothetical protein